MRGGSARSVFLALACIGLTGCVHVGQQQQQPWRLFTLSPLAAPGAEQTATTNSPGPARPAVGLGPIQLPGYLDQDQIVTRISPNRVTLSGDDRWAEPLEDDIGQMLAHNLSVLLRERVSRQPWPARERPIYQLDVNVLSFETDTAGTAHLIARWSLRDIASRQTIAEKETRLTASGAGTSTEQSVASLSKALGDFSVAMANVIRELVHSYRTQPTVGAGNRTSPTAAVSVRGAGP